MDAFFASVEQRGKPIVVGGKPKQRGAAAAASGIVNLTGFRPIY
ncbi:hypothetical protein [Leptolyngbya sp. Cla-17]|nr:hypothetical protein [Leptolyngbya sp. Cla-17]